MYLYLYVIVTNTFILREDDAIFFDSISRVTYFLLGMLESVTSHIAHLKRKKHLRGRFRLIITDVFQLVHACGK